MRNSGHLRWSSSLLLTSLLLCLPPPADSQGEKPHPQVTPLASAPRTSLAAGGEAQAARFAGKKLAPGTGRPHRSAVLERVRNLHDSGPRRASASGSSLRTTNAASFVPGLELPNMLQTGGVPTSVVTADFNRDGSMDMAIASGWHDEIWLYLGQGDGTFQVPRVLKLTQGVSPVWMTAADLRGSGISDLVVANIDSASVGVFLGNGDGTFSHEHFFDAGGNPAMLAVGEFNGDGKKDIFLSLLFSHEPSTWITLLGDGAGGFGTPIRGSGQCCFQTPFGLAASDVDGDGRDEMVVAIVGTGGGQVLKADEGGAFHIVQPVAGNGVGRPPFGNGVTGAAFADVNEDGCTDVISGWFHGYFVVRKGTCDADGFGEALSETHTGDPLCQLMAADLNRDGHQDAIAGGCNLYGGDPIYGAVGGNLISVAMGRGDGTFELARVYRAGQGVYSLAVADFNSDGVLDIAGISQDTDSVAVLLSDGAGGYRGPQGVYIGYGGAGKPINAPLFAASFADANNDGVPDMITVDFEASGYSDYAVAVTLGAGGGGRFGRTVFSSTNILVPQSPGVYRLADFTSDGKLDALIVPQDYTEAGFYILMPGRGDGSFGPPVRTSDTMVNGAMGVGDFNGDGHQDFVVVRRQPNSTNGLATAFVGNGAGSFQRMSSMTFPLAGADWISSLHVSDANRDSKQDVVVYFTTNAYGTDIDQVVLVPGAGDGTFQPARMLFQNFGPFGMADLDEDGWMDIVRPTTDYDPANAYGGVDVHLGKGDGSFPLYRLYVPYPGIASHAPLPFLRSGDPHQTAFLADYSGEGDMDAALSAQYPVYGSFAWIHLLQGNGDGTLTPTYNIYDLRKQYFWPGHAADVDLDGRAEMIELDGLRSSMHVIRTTRAPALQLYIEEPHLYSDEGHGWVLVNVPRAAGATVNLSASDAAVILPASLQVPPDGIVQPFTVTLGANFDVSRALEIRAELDGDVATAQVTRFQNVGFDVFLTPAQPARFYAGESSEPIRVEARMQPGYGGHIRFDCGQQYPYVQCNFTPAEVDVAPGGIAESMLVVSTSPTQAWHSPFEVRASDGRVTDRFWTGVDLAHFNIHLYTDYIRVVAGQTGFSDVLVNAIPPYEIGCSGLPPGITCSFETIDSVGYFKLKMTVHVAADVAPGDYTLTLQGSSSAQTYSTAGTVHVMPPPELGLERVAQTLWTLPNESARVTVRLTANESFSGIVEVSCVSAAFECWTWTPWIANETRQETLTFQPKAGLAAGVHDVTLTAKAGALARTLELKLQVVQFQVALAPNSVAMLRNASAQVELTASVSGTFSGNVRVVCGSAGGSVTCTPSPAEGAVAPGAPLKSTLTIVTSANASAPQPNPWGWLLALALPGVGLAVMLGSGRYARGAVLLCVLALLSCGGGGSAPAPPPKKPITISYPLQVKLEIVREGQTITVPGPTLTVNVTR